MSKKLVLIPLLSFLVLMSALQTAKAATITNAALNKTTYLTGQTGTISVTIYNDKGDTIRVTELTATINYYYTDGTVYLQKFYYPTELLPDQIAAGQSKTYQLSISLPTNIASGYTNPAVEARTDLWRPQDDHWATSDRPSTQVKLYIESPYKQQTQDLTTNMNILAATTVIFAGTAAFLMFLVFTRRMKPIPQP